MPKKHITSVTKSLGGDILQCGYEWHHDHFGPQIGGYKGIPRKEKEALDHLSDKEYCAAIAELANTNFNKLLCLMCSEYERVRTFCTWEGSLPHKALTRSGFFVVRDEIYCAFCNKKHDITSLKKGDEKSLKTKHHPECPLIQGEAKFNIPFNGGSVSSIRPRYHYLLSRLDAKVPVLQPVQCNDVELEKIVKEQARYKEYSTHQSRIQSFEARQQFWKSDYPFEKVTQLCDAGFFFPSEDDTEGDKIICFFCDGSLEAWLPNDDPWREHMKAYPKCAFLYMRQGEVKIHEVWNSLLLSERNEYEQLCYNFEWFADYKGESTDLPTSEMINDLKMADVPAYQFASEKGYSDDKLNELWCQDRRAFRSTVSLIKLLHEQNYSPVEQSPVDQRPVEQSPVDQRPALETTMESDVDTQEDIDGNLTQPANDGSINTCLAEDCGYPRAAVLLPCGCLCVCADCAQKAGETLRYCPLCHCTVQQSTAVKFE